MFWDIAEILIIVAVLNAQIVKTKFSCNGRTTGYYADISSGCQVYHMCDGLGRQFSYTCPNATLFQQRMLICDHWYMVNCSKSEDDYAANLLIGQREKPFVEDSESHPYYRTPRPDLLSHPTASEYNIIYRTGRKQFDNNVNLVGADNDKPETTDEPAYSLPSHWSTEYSDQSPKIASDNKFNKPTDPSVNYKSTYKNTTPVFPKTNDVVTETAEEFGLQPPIPYRNKKVKENTKNREDLKVNFHSDFINTTPVYPTKVDATSQEPGDLGVLPPDLPQQQHLFSELSTNNNGDQVHIPSLSLDFAPPKFETPYKREKVTEDNEIIPPSKFYQPPKFLPDYTELTTNEEKGTERKGEDIKSLDVNQWKNLRKQFLIPDYDFPLDSASRPSYESVFSSFQTSQNTKIEK